MFLNVIVIVSPLKPTSHGSSGGEKRISSGFVVRMIILIFPHYTIRRDNGKVFAYF